MNAVPFDTLTMARKLQASGMAGAVADGTVEALVDAMESADLATKADIAGATVAIEGLRGELKTEMASRHTDLKTDMMGRHTELRTEIATLHTQLKTDNELLRRDIVIKIGSIMVIGVGIMLAAMRYLLMHP